MKITCDSCGAKYTIADDKVRGRKVKIRCKGCGTPIVVDGAQPGAGTSTAPASIPAGELGGADGDGGLALEAAPASARGAEAAGEWSVNLSETDQRTLSTQEIVEGWKAGTITTDAFVWRDGMEDWTAILESPELAPLLKGGAEQTDTSAAPAPMAAAAQPPRASAQTGATRSQASPARIAGGRAQVGMDLFAGVETAGSDEDDIATSAPLLPQASGRPAAEDPRLTGARNENSVLFSLDALKAGFTGPKVEPEKKAPARAGARRENTDDPFGMGAGGLAGVGAPAPMFSLSDNQALLTAPAPPEPPPKPVEVVYVQGAAPAERRGPSKTLGMIAAGVLLVGAAGAYISVSSKNEEERIAQAAASAAAEADRKAREEEQKKREEVAKEAAERAAAAEREKLRAESEASKTAAPADEAAKGGASNAATAAAAPGSTRKDAPSSARRDDKKEEPKAAAAGGDQPFSKSSAISALGAAAGQASSCKKLGGPTGSGKVTVTFANSGRVTSANVNGAPFAGTSVGGCVASIFRKAKVPPFSGSSVTVSKGFSIN
jgi:predicted Zn finger-like uncharacterized protein